MTMQKVPLPQANIGFSGFGQRRKRWDEDIPWLDLADGKWLNLRFFGRQEDIVHMVATHWLLTVKSRKRFPMLCPNFNPKTREFETNGCPVCEDLDPFNSEVEEIKKVVPRVSGLSHAIVRNIQQAGGVGPDWKPWRPIRLPITILIGLQKLKDRNLHTINGVEYSADIADPYYGRDISILYDSKGSNPQAKYSIDKGDHTPLTEEEQGYISELYDFGKVIEYPSIAEIKKALTQNGYYQMLQTGTMVAIGDNEIPAARPISMTPEPPPPPTITTTAPPAAPPPMPMSSGGMDLGNMSAEPETPSTHLNSDPISEDDIPFNLSDAEAAPVAPVKEDAADNQTQSRILEFAKKLPRCKPLEICDRGKLSGLQVPACFRHYKGDSNCVRCPARIECLSN